MGSESLSGLAIMHVDRDIPIDNDQVNTKVSRQHETRMCMAYSLADD